MHAYYSWFAADKDAQTKFKMFSGKSADELRASPRAAAHATKIFSSFQTLLICRNKPAAVQELLNDLKRDHTTRHVAKANIDVIIITTLCCAELGYICTR